MQRLSVAQHLARGDQVAGAAASYVPLALPPAYRRLERGAEGTIAYAAGATANPLPIDPTDLLLGLQLDFAGTLNSGATPPTLTSGTGAPYSIIANVTLNVGTLGRIINVSGYQLNQIEKSRHLDLIDAPAFAIPAANATSVWTFSLYVPLALNDGDLYNEQSDHTGAIYTGDPDVPVTVSIAWASLAQVFATVGTATFTAAALTVTSHKLQVPVPSTDGQLLGVISWYQQIIQEQQYLNLAVGNVDYKPPTADLRIYLRLWEFFQTAAGVYVAGGVNTFDVTLQDIVDWYRTVSEYTWLQAQLRRYRQQLAAGTYVLDLSASGTRDQWLDVASVTLFKWTNATTAAVAGGTISGVSQTLRPSTLARPWIAQASPTALKEAVAA